MLTSAKTAFFCSALLALLSGCAGESYIVTPRTTRPGHGLADRCPDPTEGAGTRVCINKCIDEIVGLGRDCMMDPCSARPGERITVCEKPYACRPSIYPRFGICGEGTFLALPCLADSVFCAQGLFCAPDTCRTDTAHIPGHDFECVAPVREGQPCDDDFFGSPASCRRCEPGTSCRPGRSAEEKVCKRLCGSDGECELMTDRCLPTEGGAGSTTTCAPCSEDGQRPSAGGMCCPGTRLDREGEGGRCRTILCGRGGQECCLGTTCNAGFVCQSGMCNVCGGRGEWCCAGGACSDRADACTIENVCQECKGVADSCGDDARGAVCCQPLSCVRTWNRDTPEIRHWSCCGAVTPTGGCCRDGVDDHGGCTEIFDD
jgi:hypothetical protein